MDKVLIVDDDAQLLTILSESLKKYSNKFETIIAKDGLDAIKILQKQIISLVVTDIQMPTVNGLVLLAYMGKNFPTIPCIIMTAHGTEFSKKRLQQEAIHYIDKPFKVPELAKYILSVLDRSKNLMGSLDGISVVSFLKLIEMEYITCLCEINLPDDEKGYFLFDGGILCNAFFGNLKGEKAALKLLQLENVTIKFRRPPMQKIARRIEMPLSDLLMEAMTPQDDETGSPEAKRHVRPSNAKSKNDKRSPESR